MQSLEKPPRPGIEINIKAIAHNSHRYPTVGDYFVTPDGVVEIRVSALNDWRQEALVAVHELLEFLLVRHKGIGIDEIDAFDIDFEKHRQEGDLSEPGDDISAPYYAEHQFASVIERIMAQKLGVDWDAYADKVASL
jgi:hypothetical protein